MNRSGWPRRRIPWLLGTVALLGLGVLFGLIFGSVWLGVALGALISLGWLIAFESWNRRDHVGLDDPDDDGARL